MLHFADYHDLPAADDIVDDLANGAEEVENGTDSGSSVDEELQNHEGIPVWNGDDGEEGEEPLFYPPLYIQRYCCVEDVLETQAASGELKSLLDLGCAELKFLWRAKNGNLFERLIGLDLDEFLVGSNTRRLSPNLSDIINLRNRPLNIEIYAGDATVPDQRLVNVDAVTAIELIEHMELETHAALVLNVFDIIQPKVAIFTTPNVEYNPLFPNGSIEKRRHWDHRFEWTREEFRAWGDSVVKRFPYTVRYTGVGEGPSGTLESHGFCSQIAIFLRNPEIPRGKRNIATHSHKILRDIKYPWEPPKTPLQQVEIMIDAECWTEADELRRKAEDEEGIFNQEWFSFTLSKLYDDRWRLQNAVQPPDHLEIIRTAVLNKLNVNMKFDAEKDEVSYRIESVDNFGDEEVQDSNDQLPQENLEPNSTGEVMEYWD